jgi:hypothetical protein
MRTFKTLTSAAFCLALALAAAAPAGMPVEGATAITFSSNPAVLSGDPTSDVTITTTTTSTAGQPYIDDGKVTIELATDGFGIPVPAGTLGAVWVPLNDPGQNPVSGVTTLSVDLDGLGFVDGTVGGFRAHYVTGGGSTKVATHFSAAVDLVAIVSCEPGLHIAIDLAAGDGSPAPGYSGCWMFEVTLTNCTGMDLEGVKVQGGTNGWAPMTGYLESTGDVSVKENKKNQVLTWMLDIANGETETLAVTVCGSIKPSTPYDSILFLSGAWSAVYDDDDDPVTPDVKTEYTGRVSITVTEPTP